MKPIEQFLEVMENKDFIALGELFTGDGHYCDYCANGTEIGRAHV